MSVHGTEFVPRGEFRAQPSDRFTDDRQLLGDSVAKRVVAQKICFHSSGCRLCNPVQRFQYVVQALPITPHRSIEPQPAHRIESMALVRV